MSEFSISNMSRNLVIFMLFDTLSRFSYELKTNLSLWIRLNFKTKYFQNSGGCCVTSFSPLTVSTIRCEECGEPCTFRAWFYLRASLRVSYDKVRWRWCWFNTMSVYCSNDSLTLYPYLGAHSSTWRRFLFGMSVGDGWRKRSVTDLLMPSLSYCFRLGKMLQRSTVWNAPMTFTVLF